MFVNVNHIFLLKYYFYNELLEINEENTTQKETGQRDEQEVLRRRTPDVSKNHVTRCPISLDGE